MSQPYDALEVLRGVWSARGQTSAELDEACGTKKSCKKMADVGFDGMAGADGDLRPASKRRPAAPKGRSGGDGEAGGASEASGRHSVERPESVGKLAETLRQGGYLADRGLATALFVSLSLQRPILLEGEVGVGKTEVAKVLASVFGRKLIRLQCYEGIDTNQALYEWDYARQMLHIRALSEHQIADEAAVDKLFGPKFLLERPLLEAVRAGDQAVLLIDEIDRADDEFEAFLLELLSDLPLDRVPGRRARGADRARPGAGCVRGADPQGRRGCQPAARAGPGQAPRGRGDDRLGAHPRLPGRNRTRPAGRRGHARGRGQGT